MRLVCALLAVLFGAYGALGTLSTIERLLVGLPINAAGLPFTIVSLVLFVLCFARARRKPSEQTSA